MTARLDVTPKTTEQNRIVCTSKSEAEVTNTKTALEVSYYWRNEANYTDRHEASRGLFATAELLVMSGGTIHGAKAWNGQLWRQEVEVHGNTTRPMIDLEASFPTPLGPVDFLVLLLFHIVYFVQINGAGDDN